VREWQSSGSDGGASTELSTGVRLAGIVWELLVLAMPQNQPRRKRWTGEHAWTWGLLRPYRKKGSVFDERPRCHMETSKILCDNLGIKATTP